MLLARATRCPVSGTRSTRAGCGARVGPVWCRLRINPPFDPGEWSVKTLIVACTVLACALLTLSFAPAAEAETRQTSVDEIVAMLRAHATEPDIVEAVAERSSLETIDDDAAARLRDAGASEALVNYLRRASDRWGSAGRPEREVEELPGDPGRNGRRGFTRAGRMLLSGRMALNSYKLKDGAGSGTSFALAPGIGVFLINGLLFEVAISITVEEGPESGMVEFRPAYFIPLDSAGQFAVYGGLIGGIGKYGGTRLGVFGAGLGIAMSLGGRAGGVIRFGPELTGNWFKDSDIGKVRGRDFTLGTSLGLWF